jgi:hypothetical protein
VTVRTLARLEAIRQEFGARCERERFRLLGKLDRTALATARQVLRLHEALCLARAYPDSARVRGLVVRMLDRFDRRADLRRHRRALADTGIAGTATRFRFFAPTALRLARSWPGCLTYDWREWPDPSRLEELLPLLAVHAETPALDEWDLGLRGWVRRMTPPRMGDAAFVMRRLAARVPDSSVFEQLVDGVDAPMILAAGRGTPSRSRAAWPVRRIAWQRGPLHAGRPDLRAELQRPPIAVRTLSAEEGGRMIALAADAMVTRARDLDVFSYGDPRDVRLVDCGSGLQFAAIGALPERRLLLEAVYGFLTLKNGVPTGYVLTSALFGSAEVAYNVFETFRGTEAAAVYGRVLAMTRHLFRADAFTVFPYQLGGAGNDEGLESGAWWFYRKLGFAPLHRGARRLAAREEARLARDPRHRSSLATLKELVEHNLYWFEGQRRDDVMGVLPLANVGLAVTGFLSRRFGADPERGAAACAREARRLLGGGPAAGWSREERAAFERWAPLALLLPGVARWPAADKRALIGVMRAKGGRRESDFVAAFDAHRRLRASVATLAASARP